MVKEKYKKGKPWNKPKTEKMIYFEESTEKNSVYRGKITGQFEAWLWKLEKSKKRIAKQQKQDVKDSIKWSKKTENWKTGNIDLGKLGKHKLKAYLHMQKFGDMFEYRILYKIYDEDKERWLDYYSRTFKLPKPDDYEALDLIRRMKPT